MAAQPPSITVLQQCHHSSHLLCKLGQTRYEPDLDRRSMLVFAQFCGRRISLLYVTNPYASKMVFDLDSAGHFTAQEDGASGVLLRAISSWKSRTCMPRWWARTGPFCREWIWSLGRARCVRAEAFTVVVEVAFEALF